ncbi:hypothetical protein JCM6882_005141 [Rhodosporidiobolus microsporus]
MSTTSTSLVAVLAPALALPLSGAILSLSYSSTPLFLSLTRTASVSSSLREVRSLFSSGSHIFPQVASVSAALFSFLAYSLPEKRKAYGAAAALVASILPFTVLLMLPASNQRLIDLNDLAKKDKDAVEGKRGEVEGLLKTFGRLNAVRAVLVAAGGVVGLGAALS